MTPIETVQPTEADRGALRHLAELLPSESSTGARLVTPDGTTIDLPASAYELLREGAKAMANGDAVSVVPLDTELSTQQAADILNVSRPYLVGLLERGDIPFVRPGSQRKLRFEDLMAYKVKRDTSRRESLRKLSRDSEDAGVSFT